MTLRAVQEPGKLSSELKAQAEGFIESVEGLNQKTARERNSQDEIMELNKQLAVCSWSLQPNNPEQLVEYLKTIGILRVQIALGPLREQPQVWG
ncbi:MAG: hypothetical protein ABIP71_04295, partial [Verrucomicrobiota bacterium]